MHQVNARPCKVKGEPKEKGCGVGELGERCRGKEKLGRGHNGEVASR